MKRIQLFMIPFAGGGDYSYNDFSSSFPAYVNMIQISLPGRGSRFTENLTSDINDYVDDCFKQLKAFADKDYAIFGHSMGGLLGFLLVQKIIRESFHLPKKLIISSKSLCTERQNALTHILPQKDFFDKIDALGGSPPGIFNHPELKDIFEPILRNDFRVIEEWVCTDYYISIPVPIYIFYGKDEPFSAEQMSKWELFASSTFHVKAFEGGHFYLFDNKSEAINSIVDILNK